MEPGRGVENPAQRHQIGRAIRPGRTITAVGSGVGPGQVDHAVGSLESGAEAVRLGCGITSQVDDEVLDGGVHRGVADDVDSDDALDIGPGRQRGHDPLSEKAGRPGDDNDAHRPTMPV